MAGKNSNAINYFSPAKWVVSTVAGEGTHTSISGALSDASSGDTIFIMPGTYTENNTVGSNINICGQVGDSTSQVVIDGEFTVTGAYTVNLSNLNMQTNSTYVVAVTGSAASVVNLTNCYLNLSNNTGINYSSSSGSSSITLSLCSMNLGTTGISVYTMSSGGTLKFRYCNLDNSGSSTTASSNSAGIVSLSFSNLTCALSTSSSGVINGAFCQFNTSAINTTCITTAGTGANSIATCSIASGTASALSIGSGTNVGCTLCEISSSNTNCITGGGTFQSEGVLYTGSSHFSNVTTQSGGAASGLTQGTAPSAGYIGEYITAYQGSGTPSTGTPATIISISLSPGIWDVTCAAVFAYTGISTYAILGISTTNNTFAGNYGDQKTYAQSAGVTGYAFSLAVPSFRITLSSTTTVYAIGEGVFTTGSLTVSCRISGTRVG